MKVKTEEREGLFKALTVEVEGGLVRSALDEIYEKLRQSVEIQGFRKGTAPLWLIKAKYKDYIREEVGKKVANQTLESAIKESQLTPVADIYLERVDLEEKEEKLTYEDHALWEPVEDRGVEEGDLVTIEYEVKEIKEEGEGEKVSGETSGVVGQNMFREELEKAMRGRKAGEEVELENLPLFDQKGEEIGRANIRVKIKEVKKKVLPEVGDEFAKELGYQNWEEAEKKIEEEVRRDLDRVRRSMIESAVAEKLISLHNVEVPRTLLNHKAQVYTR